MNTENYEQDSAQIQAAPPQHQEPYEIPSGMRSHSELMATGKPEASAVAAATSAPFPIAPSLALQHPSKSISPGIIQQILHQPRGPTCEKAPYEGLTGVKGPHILQPTQLPQSLGQVVACNPQTKQVIFDERDLRSR